MALPPLIRRFSRLRVDLAQDKLEAARLATALQEYKAALPTKPIAEDKYRGSGLMRDLVDRESRLEEATTGAAGFPYLNVDRFVVDNGATIADSDSPEDN